MLLLHYKYFEESTPYVDGDVGWYVSQVADVNQADRIAKAIDELSANSDHDTKTMTEQAATASMLDTFAANGLTGGSTSETRRVGKEWVSKCCSRLSPDH